jgi:dTMP kinase
MRGTFITFEGPEGSGKTTQITRLCARLEEQGHRVLRVREPGGTPTGEAIRAILQHDAAGEPICRETEALLFAASRAQLVQRMILPALERGDCVICDRFADSTTAYQGFGRGFPIDDMLAINQFAINGAIPDLTLLLDIDPVSAALRLQERNQAAGRGPDRIEREDRAFHERVRQGYLVLAEREPERFAVLDGAQDADALFAEVWVQVKRVLHD